MNSTYKHTQVGYFILLTIGVVLAAVALSWASARGPRESLIIVAIVLAAGILFATLTIEIDHDSLRWRFGPGLIRKHVRLSDIESVEPVRNRFWYGYGIRLTPQGWLYNVSGLDAVEVRLRSGKTFRLGTDEPDRLGAAITARLLS